MSIFSDTFQRHSPPYLYGISNRAAFPGLAAQDYLDRIFSSPAHALQWREKDLSPAETRPLVKRGAELARRAGKVFLVNTHVELALQEGAGGSHLTSKQDLSQASRFREQYGTGAFLLGKSAHSRDDVLRAAAEGADYVFVSPVLNPLSKEARAPALGFPELERIARSVEIPVFALGGVVESDLERIASCGAAGLAGITWLMRAIQEPQPNSEL
ncbi:MAG: thiamine phosphate synthase [Candidatus Aminicenantes bacterium]|nr:thiamine phosphate synthase [Candidatus Aminicenantes bacterium]